MKEKIALLNLSLEKPEDYIYITKSNKITGYNYIVKQSNFGLLAELFGNPGESEMAFEEDAEEWLVTLFDKNSFEEFENTVINYFGGEQNTVSMMAVGNNKEVIEKVSEENEDVIAILDYLSVISDEHIKHCFCSIMLSLLLKEKQESDLIDTLYKYIVEGLREITKRNLPITRVYLNEFMCKFAEIAKEDIK